MYCLLASLAHIYVDAEVAFVLYICFKVGHFEVVVHPVHHEVWEKGVVSLGLEQFIEQPEAVLPEVVSEYFETHQCLVLTHTLGKQSQAEVVDVVVSHVQVDQRFIY